jgi:hypothetical protein
MRHFLRIMQNKKMRLMISKNVVGECFAIKATAQTPTTAQII